MRIMRSAVIAAATLLTATALWAQPGRDDSCGGGGKGGEHMGMVKELNLTPEQKDKLDLLRLEHRKQEIAARPQIRELREKVKEELLKPKPDKARLDDYALQMGKIHGEMAKQRHGHLVEVKGVLTPEQFQKLVTHEWRKGARHGAQGGGAQCTNGPQGKRMQSK